MNYEAARRPGVSWQRFARPARSGGWFIVIGWRTFPIVQAAWIACAVISGIFALGFIAGALGVIARGAMLAQ